MPLRQSGWVNGLVIAYVVVPLMSAGDENGPPVGAIVAERVLENVSVASASAISTRWPSDMHSLASTLTLVPERVPATVPASNLKLNVSVVSYPFIGKLYVTVRLGSVAGAGVAVG